VLMFKREILEEREERAERRFGREQKKKRECGGHWDPRRRHKRFISDSDQAA